MQLELSLSADFIQNLHKSSCNLEHNPVLEICPAGIEGMTGFVSSPCTHDITLHSFKPPTLCETSFTGHHPHYAASIPSKSRSTRLTPTARKSGAGGGGRRRSMGAQTTAPKSVGANQLPEDGKPVFNIFVRTARAKLWYPVCAISGDDQSKRLVNALKSSWGRAIYKNALDKGLAKSLYQQNKSKMLQAVIRNYPHLKKYQTSLEYGYQVMAKDLEEQPTVPVTKEMTLPFFEWVKKKWGDLINEAKKKQQSS